MATETTSTATTETGSTSTEATTTETGSAATQTTEATATETGQVTAPEATKQDPAPQEIQLPDGHPLLKTLAEQKEELKQLRPSGHKVTELEAKMAKPV